MSTSYYRLKEEITSLRLEEGPAHDRLAVWENHALAGTLTLSLGQGRRIAKYFAQTDEDGAHCPLRSYWVGGERGTVVYENGAPLPDEAIVVSEYGQVLTAAQVRARY